MRQGVKGQTPQAGGRLTVRLSSFPSPTSPSSSSTLRVWRGNSGYWGFWICDQSAHVSETTVCRWLENRGPTCQVRLPSPPLFLAAAPDLALPQGLSPLGPQSPTPTSDPGCWLPHSRQGRWC